MKNTEMESNPSDLHNLTLSLMSEFAETKNIKFLTELIDQYASVTKTFSYPTFYGLDVSDMTQRLGEMIGGIPYTSKSFPWPKMTSNGLSMQPIFQIDLVNASSILGIDLGRGILQCWGPVAINIRDLSVDSNDFLIRHISLEDLDETTTNDYPDWKIDKISKSPICHHMTRDDENDTLGKPRIQWGVPLQMFGSRQQLFEIASNDFSDEVERFGDDAFTELVDEFMDAIASSPLIGGYGSEYMGGFGGQTAGDCDPSYGNNLLLRLCDGEGFFFALHWARDRSGGLRFFVKFTIRP